MKICIVTYNCVHNYGAMLQAFALQEEIARLGHTPRHLYLLSDDNFESRYQNKIKNARSFVSKLGLILLRQKMRVRFDRFQKFLHDRIKLTERFIDYESLGQTPPDVDAFVFGSDQIWNLQSGIGKQFFGEFVPDGVPMISYAPSLGNEEVPDKYRSELRELLLRFNCTSVREERGRQLIQELTGKEVTRVLDPIFLLENDTWRDLEITPKLKRPYIAFYSLESSKRTSRIVSKLSKTTGLPVVVLGKAGAFMSNCRTKIAIDSGPAEFLGWIRNASFVVTNSFHATAFSVKFKVPFVTIAHSHRNARMEDLLESIGIGDRIIHDADQIDSKPEGWLTSLPDSMDKPLMDQVNVSKAFLANSLATIPEDDSGNTETA